MVACRRRSLDNKNLMKRESPKREMNTVKQLFPMSQISAGLGNHHDAGPREQEATPLGEALVSIVKEMLSIKNKEGVPPHRWSKGAKKTVKKTGSREGRTMVAKKKQIIFTEKLVWGIYGSWNTGFRKKTNPDPGASGTFLVAFC